ncbi:keratin, type II cytoskeletal 3-like [Meriones unguiculatus]|uniref:keratin, type II cytoskeletal 3-like n=1 Tax=Meriones unguiculatus TaxID=10047 RepID=UPI00293E1090|nr:keratin, type II cytoskeletal 3-like [Meriones unguiculatus]
MSRQVYKTAGGLGRGSSSWSAAELDIIRKKYLARSGAASARAYGIQSGAHVFGSRTLHSLGDSRRISISVAAASSKTGSFGAGPGSHGTGSGDGFGGGKKMGGGIGRTGGFGLAGVNRSRAFGPGVIQEVTINHSLLQPLDVETDPQTVRMKVKEYEVIKALNNSLVSFLDKTQEEHCCVGGRANSWRPAGLPWLWALRWQHAIEGFHSVSFLDQENKALETIWELLQQQGPRPITDYHSLNPVFENFINSLRGDLDDVTSERPCLDAELRRVQATVENYTKRRVMENVDSDHSARRSLEDLMATLIKEINFMRNLFEVRIQERNVPAGEPANNASLVLSTDNKSSLDVQSILSGIRGQFEEIAQRDKMEAEFLNQTKLLELQTMAGRQEAELRSVRSQVAEFSRLIQKWKAETEDAKEQSTKLQMSIMEAEQLGETAIRDANTKLQDAQAALRKAEDDLARLTMTYWELLDVKMNLDGEITAYGQLLEGAEHSCARQQQQQQCLGFGEAGTSNFREINTDIEGGK